MTEKEIREIWEAYNKEYGLDMEMPETLVEDVKSFSMHDVQYEMAMGSSFDDAMQRGMNF